MDRDAVLRDYKSLRKTLVPLHTRLGEMLTQDEILFAGRKLGLVHGKRLELETESEISVLMEYAIYDLYHDGQNAVDRLLLEDPSADGSDELRLLRSMQQSHYTIFNVQTPIPGFGVRGLDGPQRNPITLVDLGFSATAVPGLALATRIFSPGEGWWMTTGAALPLNHEALDRIISGMEEHERRFGVEPSEAERTALIIRACVSSGASRHVSYAGFGESVAAEAPAPLRRDSAKTARNDPCPCGSGKKYKKCCGA